MSRRTIDAPAKINLGLEILGRRDDGYHEIRTVMCTISLRDTLTFETSSTGADNATFVPHDLVIDDEGNLVLRALRAMRDAGADIPPQHVTIIKRIPAAAGLGGASSDAASTLLAFSEELRESGTDMHQLATTLGSDVPFFLNGPMALASGRGELLTPLPGPSEERWVVLVTPEIELPDKTRSMYAAVDQVWWTDGRVVETIADALPELPQTAPPNVFERALMRLSPELTDVPSRMRDAGLPFAALTGAGPTFYGLVADESSANTVTTHLESDGIRTNVARLGWTR